MAPSSSPCLPRAAPNQWSPWIASSPSSRSPTPTADHEQKAILIWNAFRERLEVSDFEGISYELGELLQEHDLTELDVEFSNEEMDTVIKTLPNNHAPGPDGFNGCFIKNVEI